LVDVNCTSYHRAAAVIPVPIAYIKVIAVEKLAVEPEAWSGQVLLSGEPHTLH